MVGEIGKKYGGLKVSAGALYPIGKQWHAEQERSCGHTLMVQRGTRDEAIGDMLALLAMVGGQATPDSIAWHEAKNLAAEWRKWRTPDLAVDDG